MEICPLCGEAMRKTSLRTYKCTSLKHPEIGVTTYIKWSRIARRKRGVK